MKALIKIGIFSILLGLIIMYKDDIVELLEENNFSNIKKLINAIKQHLCEHEIEYKVFSSLADLKKDRTASIAAILRDDITVAILPTKKQ